jgi:hypothetical protein
MICTLCGSDKCSLYAQSGARRFMRCNRCEIVFVPGQDWVSPGKERARYELHDNTPDSDTCKNYLQDFAKQLEHIPVFRPRVLDYGSGPHTVLAGILAEKSIPCASYDPLFDIGAETLNETYDIVVLCEVLEHIRQLRRELERIRALLNPGGYVAVRTELYDEHTDFESWWYAKDSTHIHFFRMTTLITVAEILNKGIYFTNARNVAVFG